MTFASSADIRTLLGSAPGWRSAFKKLYVQVLIAIALGILLGAVWPSLAIDMKPLSDGFITLIRAVVPPIIFATVTVGIAKMGDMRRVGAVGVRAIIYFEVVSTIAFTIGKFGFGILASLGQLVASIYLTSILFVLIGFGAIAWLFGLPLLKIIRYFKDELLIAFTATSGEAMIPRSIEKLQRMGCSQETVGLVLPTGFSFNTDGTSIYMTTAVLFIAQATDISLTIGQQLTILFVMLFTSKGAAGVAGAGFVALAATLPAIGVLPVGGLALLLGVERFMSEIRAVTNLFSNIFATVVVSRWMGELDDERLRIVLDGEADEPLEEEALPHGARS